MILTAMPSLLSVEPLPQPVRRSLARRQPQVLPGSAGRLTVRPLAAPGLAGIANPVQIRLRCGLSTVLIVCPGPGLDLVCQRREPGLDWHNLAAAEKPLVLEALFADVLDGLEPLLGMALRIDAVQPEPHAAFIPNFGFELRFDDIALPLCGEFVRDHLALLWAWADRLPRASPPESPVTIALRRGAATLSARDLALLSVGSGILVDFSTTEQAFAVTGETYVADLIRQDDGFRLTGSLLTKPLGPKRQIMADSDLTQDPLLTPEIGEVGSIPIRLLFDAGRIELPLAQVQNLGEGHVFPLHRQAQDAVDIIANGKIIGRGEIVSVDGLTAVRITALTS